MSEVNFKLQMRLEIEWAFCTRRDYDRITTRTHRAGISEKTTQVDCRRT